MPVWTAKGGFYLSTDEPRPAGSKDPSYLCTGVDSGVIGRRADLVILDDVVDEATSRSELMLEQRRVWLGRTVLSRLKPDGAIVIIGKLWGEGDIVDSAAESGQYVVIRMKALSETNVVEAEVEIPNGVSWRPAMRWREVAA
jgi:hypothetical protein